LEREKKIKGKIVVFMGINERQFWKDLWKREKIRRQISSFILKNTKEEVEICEIYGDKMPAVEETPSHAQLILTWCVKCPSFPCDPFRRLISTSGICMQEGDFAWKRNPHGA